MPVNKGLQNDTVDPRMVTAALYRLGPWEDEELGLDGKSRDWESCARAAGVSRVSLHLWRKDKPEEWDRAVTAAIGAKRGEFKLIGINRLAASAEGEPGSAGITAANSLLGHVGEIVPQKHEHSGPGGGPIQMVTPEMLALMKQREATEQDGGDDDTG